MNWPYAMDMNNLYLFRLNESMNRFEIKAIPMLDYILKPTYKDKNRDLLLDSIILNCTSEEDLFDSIMRCVSPLGFLGQKNRIEDLKNSFSAKGRFFASLLKKGEEDGVSFYQNFFISNP